MKRIWVTRDEEADGPLCCALRACGLEPVWEPVLERAVLPEGLKRLAEIQAGDWLVLTSPFAIQAAAEASQAKPARLAVVGEASAREAERLGFTVALCAPDGYGETLRAMLREQIVSGAVWHPHSDRARPLEAWGEVTVEDFALYCTTTRAYDHRVAQRVDLITVTSPSAVQALAEIALPVASIGRTTTAALAKRGVTPVVEPEVPGLEALAAGVAGYFEG